MFIKTGDGKILSVVETEEVTEEQKKTAQILSQQVVTQSDGNTDASEEKESGR